MMNKKLKVALVQINEKKEGMARSGHQRNSKNEKIEELAIYPYSVGLLQAYAMKYYSDPTNLEFLLPAYKRAPVQDIVNNLVDADVVGISAYIWNINISLQIAEGLKSVKPEIIIIFGGPQVPDQSEQFLRDNPFIDLCCHGEGEQVFLSVLEHYQTRDWASVPSLSYLDEKEEFHLNPRIARSKNLPDIPSPYLEGTFEPLRAANPSTRWIMLWETNRGCPFSCAFCDWGSAVGTKVNKFDDKRLYRELEWFAKTGDDIIFCCDANFGMLPRDLELAEFAVLIKSIYKHPRILTVQNTKNATEKGYRVQKLLASSMLNPVVTLSVQSINEETLGAIKRKNISLETFRELQRRFTKDKILTYTDVILGMPNETYDTFFDGVSKIIQGGQHHRILFYNLSILPNAEMGNPIYQERYGLEFVPQLIQNMHTHLYEIEECEEYIDTVISSSSMPRQDWIKGKRVWWITEMLYYNHILKLPFAVLQQVYKVSYRQLLEAFMYPNKEKYPIINFIRDIMESKAKDIQSGGKEFYPSADWLNIFWTTEQYIWIDIIKNKGINNFYVEAIGILCDLLLDNGITYDSELVSQLCEANSKLMTIPYQSEDNELTFDVDWNMMEVFNGVVTGEPIDLVKEQYTILCQRKKMDFDEWLEHQIVCQNMKAKQWHLYTSKANRSIGLSA